MQFTRHEDRQEGKQLNIWDEETGHLWVGVMHHAEGDRLTFPDQNRRQDIESWSLYYETMAQKSKYKIRTLDFVHSELHACSHNMAQIPWLNMKKQLC